jgi:glutamate 5-kinase
LRQKKRISILEIGITDSVGNFDIWDLIEVSDTQGIIMGKWLAKISAKVLKKYTNNEKSQVVIHANYFVYTQ